MNLFYILLLVLWSAFNSTSFFLIYNKDHNKCVYARSATEVLTAPCDASLKAQRFQWISSSRIISLDFSLCLGAEKIENWVKIILQPCKELSPMQTWECKNQTLFGLKGLPLHLNYGNYDEPNVMLFNGTGVWSHWLIFGTVENLCFRGYQDAPVPNITVFRQNQDREHVLVMCSFGRRFTESSFQLSMEGEHNYTLKNPLCYSNEMCVFDVKVSTPVSFTCVHEINSAVNRHSETYTDEEGVSLFYICFSSSIAVGLFIMTVAVIVTNNVC